MQNCVTPHVGVWIETKFCIEVIGEGEVTPHVGVWIETTWNNKKCKL